MKIVKRLKSKKTDICVLIGLFGFFMLSGAVPENPDGLTQGIVSVALIAVATIVGIRGEKAEEND